MGTFRLVEAMARGFGGAEALAQAWYDSLQEARRQRPGSATVLRSFMAIAKLAPLARKAQEGIPGQRSFDDWLNTATEEELEEALDQALLSLLEAPSEEVGHSPKNALVGEPPEDAGLL